MKDKIKTFKELEKEVRKLLSDSELFEYNKSINSYELYFAESEFVHHNFQFNHLGNPQKIYNVIKAIKECEDDK